MNGAGSWPLGERWWPLADVLALPSSDTCGTVSDALSDKRTQPHYAELLADVAENGLREPVLFSAEHGTFYDGHHRVAVAQELGLSHLLVRTVARAYDEDGAA